MCIYIYRDVYIYIYIHAYIYIYVTMIAISVKMIQNVQKPMPHELPELAYLQDPRRTVKLHRECFAQPGLCRVNFVCNQECLTPQAQINMKP